jgi:DNA-binding MarR family transcriptional regulator
MTLSQFSVLHHLIRLGGDWSPARLASAFQVTRSTMTNTLQRLQIAGYIEMASNSNDGRAKLVCITPLGQTTCQAAIGAVAADIDALSVMLPDELMASIHSGLAALRKVLDTQR